MTRCKIKRQAEAQRREAVLFHTHAAMHRFAAGFGDVFPVTVRLRNLIRRIKPSARQHRGTGNHRYNNDGNDNFSFYSQ
jgi:hypothetical protein